MAYEAYAKNATRVAMVFANTPDAQTEVPGIAAGAKHWHLKIVNDTALVTGQTAYQSEVQRIVASKPQAVLSELDPATAATFWGQ
jgi:ABC-type branched-subunit amino acid transport system substrate-binding protein